MNEWSRSLSRPKKSNQRPTEASAWSPWGSFIASAPGFFFLFFTNISFSFSFFFSFFLNIHSSNHLCTGGRWRRPCITDLEWKRRVRSSIDITGFLSLSLSLFLGKKKVHGVRGWGGGGGGSSVAFKARFFYWVVTEFCFVLFFALLALRSISGLWLSNRNRHHCSFFYFRFFTKDVWRASFIDGSYLNWVFLMRP